MVQRFQRWLNRQPLTVKLIVGVVLLLAAIAWSSWPSTTSAGSLADTSNRPVLSREDPHAGAAPATPAAGAPVAPANVPASATQAPLLPQHQEPQTIDSGMNWATLLRTVFSVAVVIILILISARVLKHFMTTAGQQLGADSAIRILETAHLPAPNGKGRSALSLIEVGESVLLIGATDQQLSLLAEFADPEIVERLRRAKGGDTSSTPVALEKDVLREETLSSANGAADVDGASTIGFPAASPAFDQVLAAAQPKTNGYHPLPSAASLAPQSAEPSRTSAAEPALAGVSAPTIQMNGHATPARRTARTARANPTAKTTNGAIGDPHLVDVLRRLQESKRRLQDGNA